MLKNGLVSVSFRKNSVDEILISAKKCNLQGIEWGSDIHIKPNDLKNAKKVYEKTTNAGIFVAAYGSYFKIGEKYDPIQNADNILETAKVINAKVIRIWAGNVSSSKVTTEYLSNLVKETQNLCDKASEFGINIAFECHNDTLTDEFTFSGDLIEKINRPNMTMYWQPNQFRSNEYNLNSLHALLPFISNVHVFNWSATQRMPLNKANEIWSKYIDILKNDGKEHYLLLEFMPNDDIEMLSNEAKSLKNLIKGEANGNI